MNVTKLKRAVIKEELVAITGDYVKAILLNQLLYWTDRMYDVDKYLREETARISKHGNEEVQIDLTHGWIYKKADELSEETLLCMAGKNLLKHLNQLIEMGYVSRRNNEKYKYDRTYQYRVNMENVIRALNEKGYSLDGYRVGGMLQKVLSEVRKVPMSAQKVPMIAQKVAAIPDISSDTTSKNKISLVENPEPGCDDYNFNNESDAFDDPEGSSGEYGFHEYEEEESESIDTFEASLEDPSLDEQRTEVANKYQPAIADLNASSSRPDTQVLQEAKEIYDIYPTKDVNNNNRSTGKSRDRDVKKIVSLLNRKKKYPLKEAVSLYVEMMAKKRGFLKNLSVFLNGLPDEAELEQWRKENGSWTPPVKLQTKSDAQLAFEKRKKEQEDEQKRIEEEQAKHPMYRHVEATFQEKQEWFWKHMDIMKDYEPERYKREYKLYGEKPR
jgi:hypothetical protein